MADWKAFLAKYTAFGRTPSVERYVDLFDPQGTVFHPGMAAPIGIKDIPTFIANVLTRLEDFQLIPMRWCVNTDTIFVEANNTAHVAGKRLVWPATYCITLRGERVLRGRAYYDRTEVLSHFDPALAARSLNVHATLLDSAESHDSARAGTSAASAAEIYDRFVTPYVENWKNPDPQKFAQFYSPEARMINPGFERALRREELAGYYRELRSQTPDLQLRLETWAASPGLLFLEWTAVGTFLGKPLKLPVVDRFILKDCLAVEGVAYFDGLTLRALVDPSFARFADIAGSTASVSR